MEFYEDEFGRHKGEVSLPDDKPGTWSIEEGDELTEDDLQLELFFDGDEVRPVREGQPMGGQNFGRNNVTTSANDKNNPSQYAGNHNAYFNRTEPMEEHPENSNLRVQDQLGLPDYDKAQPGIFENSNSPKPEPVEKGNGENDRPHKGGDQYQQGTVDDDEPNIAGPNELPDQQKVGEDVDGQDDHHVET